jgi:hypothetical protein
MINDRYTIEHRMSAIRYVKVRLKRILRGILDPVVPYFQTDIETVFVVGCGHSGTTLVAAKLSRLTGCYCASWETNAFHPDLGLHRSRAIFGALIANAEASGARVIVEKTPKHVHCQERILRLLPKAKFVVVLRNPLDTCASLFRRFGDLDYSIERWNLDNEAALALLQSKASKTVRYENLVRHSLEELSALASFSGLDWSDSAAEEGATAFSAGEGLDANMLLRSKQVSEPIAARVNVWSDVLTPAMVDEVTQRTAALAKKLGY